MSDENHDLLKIARDNYGILGVCVAFVSMCFGVACKPIARCVRWVFSPSRYTIAIEDQTREIRHIAQSMDRALMLAALSEQKSSVADIRTRILMKESAVARWETDADGHCVEANDALCSIFELPRDEMLGTKWTRAIAPGCAPAVMAAFSAAYAGVNDYEYNQQYAIIRKGGRELVNLVASSEEVLRDSGGKVIRMFGKVRYQPTLVDDDGGRLKLA